MTLIAKQLKSSGLDIPIVNSSSIVEPTATALFEPAELAGMCAETPSAPEARSTPAIKAWADAYLKRFGIEPDGLALGQYDGVMMALTMMSKGAKTPEDMRAALQKETYHGVAMTYKSNGHGDLAHDADIVCWDGSSRIPKIVAHYAGEQLVLKSSRSPTVGDDPSATRHQRAGAWCCLRARRSWFCIHRQCDVGGQFRARRSRHGRRLRSRRPWRGRRGNTGHRVAAAGSGGSCSRSGLHSPSSLIFRSCEPAAFDGVHQYVAVRHHIAELVPVLFGPQAHAAPPLIKSGTMQTSAVSRSAYRRSARLQ